MKAILVMEMPENCLKCSQCIWIGSDKVCVAAGEDRICNVEHRPSMCPLKPMPARKMELGKQEFYMREHMQSIEVPIPENKGWNACIDAIEGSK